MKSEKYMSVHSTLVRKFEDRIQDGKKKFFCILSTPQPSDINTLPVNLQMEFIELQSDIQVKKLIA